MCVLRNGVRVVTGARGCARVHGAVGESKCFYGCELTERIEFGVAARGAHAHRHHRPLAAAAAAAGRADKTRAVEAHHRARRRARHPCRCGAVQLTRARARVELRSLRRGVPLQHLRLRRLVSTR